MIPLAMTAVCIASLVLIWIVLRQEREIRRLEMMNGYLERALKDARKLPPMNLGGAT